MNKQEKLREDITAFVYSCELYMPLQSTLNNRKEIKENVALLEDYYEKADELLKYLEETNELAIKGRGIDNSYSAMTYEIESLIGDKKIWENA